MNPIDLNQLSREYVIAHEGLSILSWEYVIEHGVSLGVGELWWDPCYGYYICDCEGVYYTGLLYGVYDNLSLRYYAFYEDGVKNGIKITFYSSGEMQSYSFYSEGEITGIYYEWYENGMIKKYIDRIHDKRIEVDEQGKITKQGKAD